MVLKGVFRWVGIMQLFMIPLLCQAQPAYSGGGLPDQVVLNVTENLSSSIAVSWRTGFDVSDSKIQIAEEYSRSDISDNAREYPATATLFDVEGSKTWHHSVLIENLKPNTYYAYRLGNGSQWSEWFNFKTAGSTYERLTFLYFGDIQNGIKSLWSRVARQAMRSVPQAQLALYAGDIVNRGDNGSEWDEWFCASSVVNSNIPLVLASGNHDHVTSMNGVRDISAYWNMQFNLPKNGPEAVENSCYFADLQNVRFIVLNTELFNHNEHIAAAQTAWLEEVLDSNPNRWTVMLFHHPIFSTKKNRDNMELRAAIKPLIERYGVDLVLQGHDHTYARGIENTLLADGSTSNTAYVVSVSGSKMYELEKATWMDVSLSDTQVFHAVEIEGDSLSFSTYNVVGDRLDFFEIRK